MQPRYAVIPAAGAGKRIAPYSQLVPKPMIQVLGRPILAYVLDQCKRAGLTKVIIIMNPTSTAVKDYFGDGSGFGLSIEYVAQPKPEGIGQAVGLTEGIVKPPFAVYLGDEIYLGSDHPGFIKRYNSRRSAAAIGLMWVEDENLIRGNYSVDIDLKTHVIRNLVEKPTTVANKILGCGSYIFNDTVFDAIRKTPKSAKGEVEITDTLNTMTRMGLVIQGYFLGGTYLNITYPADIARAEAMIRESEAAGHSK
jgi:dTDP-glucose pyrophosphorylase